jgi:hypothetical protein
MPALAVVGGIVPPLRFAAPDMTALRADPEIERAPALLAGSTARLGYLISRMHTVDLVPREHSHGEPPILDGGLAGGLFLR